MKNILNYEKFNELNSSTYRSAANKLAKMGHVEKANRLNDHIHFIDNMKNIYKDMEPFKFLKTNGVEFTGKLMGIDAGAAYDSCVDNDFESFSLPVFFAMTDVNGNKGTICPFWILVDTENDKFNVEIGESTNLYDTKWESVIEDGVSPILFNNVKDAKRLIDFLKNEAIKNEWTELKGNKLVDSGSYVKVFDIYNKVVNKLNTKMFYR